MSTILRARRKGISVSSILISGKTVSTAIRVSLIVGTILNMINQGNHLIALDFDAINIPKFILNYIVPYSVSTYSSLMMRLKMRLDGEC